MFLENRQIPSNAVVHFGDIPADCMARVVGYDQPIFHERPSELAVLALAIHPDFRAFQSPSKDEPTNVLLHAILF